MKKIFIIHIGNFLLDGNSGVAQKTFAQAAEFRLLGREVQVVAFTSREDNSANHSNTFTAISTRGMKSPYEAVTDFFKQHVHPGDSVFLRYPFASQGLLNLVQTFGHQIVFEHNTIEHQEVILSQREHFWRQSFSLRASYFAYFLKTFVFRRTREHELGAAILKHVAGGICVTNEIASYEQSRCSGYRTIGIGNGGPEPETAPSSAPEFNTTLRVVMVVGTLHSWHGVDRIMKGLKKYTNEKVFIELDFIGFSEEESEYSISTPSYRVKALGRMNSAQLERAMMNYHLAIGSLALHRIGLKEASPLKVRQCLMAGVPMVLGYDDTDVSHSNSLSTFICQFPANDSLLDWERIVRFYNDLIARPDFKQDLSKAARMELSMGVKARACLEFIDSCTSHKL